MASELSVDKPCANGCGKTTGKILGRGMCGACYQKIRTAEKARDKEIGFSDLETSQDHDIASESGDDFIEDLSGSPEIRPGSYPNPSVSQDGSEGLKDSKSSAGGKFRDFVFGSGKTENIDQLKAPKTNERRPTGDGKRKSGAELIGSGWEILGGIIARSERHRGTGYMLAFQSEAAGETLDEAIKGTVIDRLGIQKMVKAKGTLDSVGSVLLPPALVFAIEMNPERAPMLMPMLASSIRNSLPKMVKPIEKVRKRKADEAEAIKKLFPDLPEGVDPVDSIMREIFPAWYSQASHEDQNQNQGA